MEEDWVPEHILKAAKEAERKILPQKSVKKYYQAKEHFDQWRKKEEVTSLSERVFLA